MKNRVLWICILCLLLMSCIITGCSGVDPGAEGLSPSKTPKNAQQDARVEQLIAQVLDDSLDNAIRAAAAQELGAIGDKRAIEPLIEALQAGWYPAIEPLGDIGDPRAIEPLIDVIRSSDLLYYRYNQQPNYFPNDAMDALKKIGDPVMEKLISSLEATQDDYEKANIIVVMGAMEDARAVEPLMEYLPLHTSFWGDGRIHICMQEALVKIGSPAVEPLIEVLENYEPNIYEEAIILLGRIGDTRAVEPLITALQGTDHFYPREKISEALGNIGDERAVEPLINLFESITEEGFRRPPAEALGMIGNAQAIDFLLSVARNREDMKWRSAYFGLMKTDDARVVKILNDALDTADLEVLSLAYNYYIRLGRAGSVPILIDALWQYGDPGMATALINSGNPELKDAAINFAKEKGYMLMPPGGQIGGGASWGQGNQE